MAGAGQKVDTIGSRAAVQEFVQDSECPEGAQCRATDSDPGAVGTPARIDFDQIDARPDPAQLDGCGHPGKAAADDENFCAPGRHG
jgi:hypothetical protein